MANFNINDFLNPLLSSIYNPGAFSDKVNQSKYLQPYLEDFNKNYVPNARNAFVQTSLDPFNLQAQNETRNYNINQSQSGGWRTGQNQFGANQLAGQQNQQRNLLETQYKTDISNKQNQLVNTVGDYYSQLQNQTYLTPTYFTKPTT